MPKIFNYPKGFQPRRNACRESLQHYMYHDTDLSFYELRYDDPAILSDGKPITVPQKEYRASWSDDTCTHDTATDVIPQALLTEEQLAALDVAQYRERIHTMGLSNLDVIPVRQLIKGKTERLWSCRPEPIVPIDSFEPERPVVTARALGSLVIATAPFSHPLETRQTLTSIPCYAQADIPYFLQEGTDEPDAFMFESRNCQWRTIVHGDLQGYMVADVQLFNTRN